MQKLILFFLILLSGSLTGQTDIWTVGNLADADPSFFVALRQLLSEQSENIHLIVTGDLVRGCPPADGSLPPAVAGLFSAIRDIDQVEVEVIPGDRDWDHAGPDGYACALRLENLIEKEGPKNIHWPVDKACPGPAIKELGKHALLISLNTQWWNHRYDKPQPSDGRCDFDTPDVILEEIRDGIDEAGDRTVLLAGHFPPESLGRSGGRFPLTDYLVPVAGPVRIAFHQVVGTDTDLSNTRFNYFRGRLDNIFDQSQGLLYLSAQDANQQVVATRDNYIINSGAPVRAEYAADDRDGRLSLAQPGLMTIAIYKDGKATYQFRKFTGSRFETAESGSLFQSPCDQSGEEDQIPVNPRSAPCSDKKISAPAAVPTFPSSVQVVPGPQYRAGALWQFVFGEHYRRSWTTEIQAPVLRLDTLLGGLQAVERGGGRQTQSLKLETPEGRSFVFRSVDKDPTGAFDYRLRKTVLGTVARDQTSSEEPFGALVVSPLLDKLGILHARPQLYYMPDDPALGAFRPQFANMLGLLEERPNHVGKNEPAFAGADEIYKSHQLFRLLYNDPAVEFAAEEFARARIFDLLVGDWSKHEDNWKWAGFAQPDGHLQIRPIPRDRDHVFSKLDGLLPWLASRPGAIPTLEGFRRKKPDVQSLTHQARHMDRLLLVQLNREDWQRAARTVQQTLTDEDLKAAVRQLPAEDYAVVGSEISDKLLARRQDLAEYAEDFYTILSKIVDVVGTNERDHFVVENLTDGSTRIQVWSIPETAQDSVLHFERTFLPAETEEVRLYGLGQSDHFYISGPDASITLRLIPGENGDTVLDRTSGKHLFLYQRDRHGQIHLGRQARWINDRDDIYYQYDRTNFEPDRQLPLFYFSFNSRNGLVLGGGLSFTQQGFGKPNYASRHKLWGAVSTYHNYELNYGVQWHYVFGHWDIVADASVARPIDNNYFFGLGNATVKEDGLFDDGFYLIGQNRISGNVGVHRDFFRFSDVKITAGYERGKVWGRETPNILETVDLSGEESLSIPKLNAELSLDLRDDHIFPRRGIRLQADHELGLVRGDTYNRTDLAAEFFITPRVLPVTFGFRADYAFTQGAIPFYKLPRLGMQEGLRGFQQNRFTGDRRLYFQSGLWIPIASFQTAFIPLSFGLTGFYDLGRVSTEAETRAGDFHHGYGGGFYLVPLSRSFTISLTAGFSKEESGLIRLHLGTNF